MTRTSKAAARRLAAQHRAERAAAPALDAALVEILDGYTPERIDAATWAAVRATHRWVMESCSLRGVESFRKRVQELAAYLAWRHEQALALTPGDSMTYDAIDDYCRRGCAHLKAASRATRRSRLRRLAEDANPGLDALRRATPIGHQAIRPGYSPAEEAAIRRVALRQRREKPRRALCAVVGLCAGAGLDSIDLRNLRRRDIDDRGEGGIVVNVPRPRPRRTVVRRDYEEIVRAGLAGLRPGALIIGGDVPRRNVAGSVVENAEIHGDVPHIEAGRLRATWLSWLMTRPVPLGVILDAAGLRSARTLSDLLSHLPPPADDRHAQLRGEEDR